jgi:hypothetical protein
MKAPEGATSAAVAREVGWRRGCAMDAPWMRRVWGDLERPVETYLILMRGAKLEKWGS